MTSRPPLRLPRSSGAALIALLAAMAALDPLGTQALLPGLPAIQADFGVSPGKAQLVLSLPIFAMAFTDLIYGPLSDRFGRRPIALAALVLGAIGCSLALMAPSLSMLVAARIVLSCGASVGIVLSRAIAIDVYGEMGAVRVISLTLAAMAAAPSLAPFFGGLIVDSLGWRALFAVLLVLILLVLAWATLALPETNSKRGATGPSGDGVRNLLQGFTRLARTPAFLAYAAHSAFAWGVFFAFIGTAPYLMSQVFHRPALEFGLWIMPVAVGYISGSLMAGVLAGRFGLDRPILAATPLGLAAIGVSVVLFLTGTMAPSALFLPGVVLAFCIGVTIPNSQAGACGVMPEITGTASSLVSFLLLIVGATMAQVSGMVQDGSPFPMLGLMGASGAISLLAILIKVSLRGVDRANHSTTDTP